MTGDYGCETLLLYPWVPSKQSSYWLSCHIPCFLLVDPVWPHLTPAPIGGAHSQAPIGWACTMWTPSYWLRYSDPTWPLLLLVGNNNRLSLVELATCGSLLIGWADMCTISFSCGDTCTVNDTNQKQELNQSPWWPVPRKVTPSGPAGMTGDSPPLTLKVRVTPLTRWGPLHFHNEGGGIK